jgi:hypothetical protein
MEHAHCFLHASKIKNTESARILADSNLLNASPDGGHRFEVLRLFSVLYALQLASRSAFSESPRNQMAFTP